MANLKYDDLNDDVWLEAQLMTKSRMELAKELAAKLKEKMGDKAPTAQVLHGCITHRMKTRFSDEKQQQFKRQREPNKTKKSLNS